jgi:choline monooxygenase
MADGVAAASAAALDLTDFTPDEDLARAWTMPARWYTEPRFLDLEKERIFWRSWQPVGRLEMVRRAGDHFTCDVLGEPLVVVRGLDDTLRAFYNVCRHRAGAVAHGKGNRRTLQCAYHGWTYDLEGCLIKAREFEGVENWSETDFRLQPVRVETWGPLVFVNPHEDPIPLDEVLSPISAEVAAAGFDVASMALVERRDYQVGCNWKVYVDNYLEGYHIPIAHPGLFREIDYEQYRVETFRYHSQQHAPIRAAGTGSAHRDRRYVRMEGEEQALYYWVFPNVMLNFYPDNLQVNIVVPLAHDRTLTIFEWYFAQPGSGEGWESTQQSVAFSDEIQHEDIALCEAVQQRLNSRAYDRGRFCVKRENGVHHFQTLVHEFLTRPG